MRQVVPLRLGKPYGKRMVAERIQRAAHTALSWHLRSVRHGNDSRTAAALQCEQVTLFGADSFSYRAEIQGDVIAGWECAMITVGDRI